jgi:hypothetical protein
VCQIKMAPSMILIGILYRYRRNVGDTLINACYVLRDQFLETLLGDMRIQLAQTQTPEHGNNHWEVVYFILHMPQKAHNIHDYEGDRSNFILYKICA